MTVTVVMRRCCHGRRVARHLLADRSATPKCGTMEPRFTLTDNEIGAKFAKRFGTASLAIIQSPLPKITQELVSQPRRGLA